MKKIQIAAFCTLVIMSGTATADSVDVGIFSVTDNDFVAPDSGVIIPYDQYGNSLDYEIRLGIENDAPIGGISLGLRIWSDNVTWEWMAQDSGWGPGGQNTGLSAVTVMPGSRMDPVLSVWDMGGLQVTEKDMDGSGADSILLGGLALNGGLAAGPMESMLAIHFRIKGFTDPGWLCINRAVIPPAGNWLFVDSSGHGYAPPTNCPVCYAVAVLASDGTGDPAAIPGKFTLEQNRPNPFNPMTTISYSLPRAAHVQICIHNILGQILRTLVDKTVGPGTHRVVWDGTDSHGKQVASGIYFYRMMANGYSSTRKMTLLR